jgi:hypothetical protein
LRKTSSWDSFVAFGFLLRVDVLSVRYRVIHGLDVVSDKEWPSCA